PMTGAPGTVAGATGVTTFDDADGADEPTAFTVTTWNVYDVPLVSPVTTRLVADDAAVRSAPTCRPVALSTTRTSYRTIGEPPLLVGAVHRAVASALPADAAPKSNGGSPIVR